MRPQEIFNHYTSIMDEMIASHDFWKIYFQAPMPLYNERDIPYFLYSGATRSCLVDNTFPYVVKWDTIEAGATGCQREEELYCKAVNEHLEQYFLEPIYLGQYKRSVVAFGADDFYDERALDEKYYPTADEYSKTILSLENEGCIESEHEINIALWAYSRAESASRRLSSFGNKSSMHNSYYNYRFMDTAGVECWIDEIGEKEFNRLYEFIRVNDIVDLHSGNIMCSNKHLVFSDYAGI